MAKVVYQQRHSPTESYDTAIINLLENNGVAVEVIINDVSNYDFSDVDLLICGAPGTDFLANPSSNFISSLDIPIISLCRRTSRETLGMADNSGIPSLSFFRVVDNTHPVMQALGWESGSYTIGGYVGSHRISTLTPGTNLIMDNGETDMAGLAERIENDKSKIHFGYHRFDVGNDNLFNLFRQTLIYLIITPINLILEAEQIDNLIRLSWEVV